MLLTLDKKTKIMKKFLFILALLISGISAVNAQSGTKPSEVEAYYFHFTSRCETCRTVEAEAKADIQNLYGGQVSFQSINLDDASSKAIAEKLKISGQTLLIVKGDQKINLTNEGFLYAMQNPAKLKAIIKQKVDKLIGL